MGISNYERVYEFHNAFEARIGNKPEFPDQETIDLRLKLIDEEVKEVKQAVEKRDIVNLAQELADIAYVVYGMAITFGIDLDDVFEEVHKSNMSKLGVNGEVLRREDGKVLKGPHYRKPNVARVMFGADYYMKLNAQDFPDLYEWKTPEQFSVYGVPYEEGWRWFYNVLIRKKQ